MEIVIKIDDKEYEKIKHDSYYSFDKYVAYIAIKNGTPLPKGHGRLIDADALNVRMEQRINEIGDDRSIWEASGVETALDMFASTVIEADKE